MMRSMFSGVAGLRAHQTMMDVVGNNIANVNTAGFKASEVTFQEALTQVMRGPSININPLQLGLGVQVAGIDPVFTQGASQVTGRARNAVASFRSKGASLTLFRYSFDGRRSPVKKLLPPSNHSIRGRKCFGSK